MTVKTLCSRSREGLSSPLPAILALTALVAVALPGSVQSAGTHVWRFPTGLDVHTSPVLDERGTVFFGSTDRHVYAVDQRTGELKWSQKTGGAVEYSLTVGSDGVVYAGSADKYVYAFDGETGEIRWTHYIAAVPTGMALGANGLLYVGDKGGFLQALDRNTGLEAWNFVTLGGIYGNPAIGAGGVIYFGSDDNHVYALNGKTGAELWEFAATGNVSSSPAIGTDGTVYVGAEDRRLYALDGKTGREKWHFIASGPVWSPVIGADNTLYVGSSDNNLYAVNPANGVLKKKANYSGDVRSIPAIGADGTLYFHNYGMLRAVDKDLNLLWQVIVNLTSSGASRSSVAIAQDGTLFVGSLDNALHAVRGSSTAGPALTPWPMEGQSAQRAGRGWFAPFRLFVDFRDGNGDIPALLEGSAGRAYQVNVQDAFNGSWAPFGVLTNHSGTEPFLLNAQDRLTKSKRFFNATLVALPVQ